MSIELSLREVDADGKTKWETRASFYDEHLWGFPEYRQAVFDQAAKTMGRKYDEYRGATHE